MTTNKLLLIMLFMFFACTKDEASSPEPEDCAGNSGGNAICGCTDSTAYNYDSDATHDDGNCQTFLDNGDYYLTFNGSNSNVNLGDMIDQGPYTKAAWVKRNYGYGVKNNIVSGNKGHAFYAPFGQGARLSSGHNGNYNAVQDPDSLPEAVWTFVAVTYDPGVSSGTMTLYTSGVKVDQATGIEPPEDHGKTYIGKFSNANIWYGSIDEVAIWDKALSDAEISELSGEQTDMNANVDRGNYASSDDLAGYWKLNEGEGALITDASGNGNLGTMSFAHWNTCDECGCTDETACNHDPSATIENRTCEYVEDACASCIDGEVWGNDHDMDGVCDDMDEDDDNDNVTDDEDSDPFDNTVCSDTDGDGCDDCSYGVFNPNNDGPDDDGDGMCNSFLIPGKSVYIVGDSYDDQGNYTACYWVDGTRVELPGGAWATDIVVIDGTVYACGTGESSDACYWIDQTRYDLPGNWGEAEAITVHDGDVYVAGWFDDGSCYWKNGQKINLTTNRDSQAFAIGVKNNGDVFVGGYAMNNHHVYVPCYWKNGSKTNLSAAEDGEVNDLTFLEGNVRYFAGYTTVLNNMTGYPPRACYWRNSRRTDLPQRGNWASTGLYGTKAWGITIDGSDVYIAGSSDYMEDMGDSLNTGGTYPEYWKNDSKKYLPGGPPTDFGTGEARDIRVADGYVVVVGIATRDPDYSGSYTTACYWLNGELNYLVSQYDVPEELGLDDWEHSIARGVHIE